MIRRYGQKSFFARVEHIVVVGDQPASSSGGGGAADQSSFSSGINFLLAQQLARVNHPVKAISRVVRLHRGRILFADDANGGTARLLVTGRLHLILSRSEAPPVQDLSPWLLFGADKY